MTAWMPDFDMERLVPKFLLHDTNGYALAKAIEAALNAMCRIVQTGIDTTLDIDKMPEWRLDELAQERQCLYDYNADIEQKRAWIRDAMQIYRIYGTPAAIRQYLEAAFERVEIREAWKDGGEPYHFSVEMGGDWDDAKRAWAMRAINEVRNVRSVLDGVTFAADYDQQLYMGLVLHETGNMALEMAAVPGDLPDYYVNERNDALMNEQDILLFVEG